MCFPESMVDASSKQIVILAKPIEGTFNSHSHEVLVVKDCLYQCTQNEYAEAD